MEEPQWTTSPTTEARRKTLSLRRVGCGRLMGVSLSHKPIGCETHYWRGRTRPHMTGSQCEACEAGNSSRWRGYLALYDKDTRETFLAELTPKAYEGIKEGLDSFGSLRGHWIKIERTRPKETAPVRATVSATMEPEERLPAEPDIQEQMYRIWSLKENAVSPDTTESRIMTHIHALVDPNKNGRPKAAV